jgi:methylenetetrahydrofolate reductase (NADPH)
VPVASVLPPTAPTVAEAVAAARAESRPSVSFEFFPPKDAAGEELLWSAVRRVEQEEPDFVSVTYGAGGGTQDRTVAVTQRMSRETTLTVMAHLTCVGRDRAQLRHVVGAYADAGVRSVLALRGDPPGGPGSEWVPCPDGLDRAVDLVRLVHGLGRFSVGVAAFPETHPESPSLEHDARVLALKAEAGAAFAVTQFFFEAEPFLRLRDALAATGADLPLVAGIMPVTDVRQIRRFAELSGTAFPDWLAQRVQAVGDDPAAVRAVGVEVATDLSRRLVGEGVDGLHFYTLNRSTATLEVHRRLGLARALRAAPGDLTPPVGGPAPRGR